MQNIHIICIVQSFKLLFFLTVIYAYVYKIKLCYIYIYIMHGVNYNIYLHNIFINYGIVHIMQHYNNIEYTYDSGQWIII